MSIARIASVTSLALICLAPQARGADWLAKAKTKKLKLFDGTTTQKGADRKRDRRGKVVVRRIKPLCKSDWNTDPTALPHARPPHSRASSATSRLARSSVALRSVSLRFCCGFGPGMPMGLRTLGDARGTVKAAPSTGNPPTRPP